MKTGAKWIVAGTTILTVSLLIWQRKLAGESASELPEVKSLKEFDALTPDSTTSQRMLLFAGNRLYLRGDINGAHRVYDHLHQELPDNEVVRYNFELSRPEE